MPPYLHWNQAPKGQQVPEQDISCKFSSNTGTHHWASIYRQLKLLQNHWHLITHYWALHCTPERRNPAPPTRTPTSASLTKKPWQATDTTPPTARNFIIKRTSQAARIQKDHHKCSNIIKMKIQRNTQHVKEQEKCPPNQTKEEEIGNLPEKVFW